MKDFALLLEVGLLLLLLPCTVSGVEITNTSITAIEKAITAILVDANENVNGKQIDYIGEALHGTTQPCENFLHYACGNWPYFMESDIHDMLHIIDAKVNEEFRELFESGDPKTPEMNFMKQARNYYESCADVEPTKKPPNPLEYLKWLEVNENLKWLAFDAGNSSQRPVNDAKDFHWLPMLAIFRKYGLNNLILHEEAIQHPLDNTKMVIALKKPCAESAMHFLGPLEDEHRKFTLWNISDSLEHRQFVEFDLELAKVLDYHKNDTAEEPQLMTFQKLKELHLEWLEIYLIIALHPVQLEPQMEIYIQDVDYFRTIKLFLDEFENPALLAQYLQLNFLSNIISVFSDPGYYDCLISTRLQFPLVMQWLYKKYHPEITYEFYKIHLLFSNLKRVLKNRFSTSFNDNVLEAIVSKVDNLKLQILDVWQPALEHFYEDLRLHAFDYIGNRLKLRHKDFLATHHYLGDFVAQGALEFLHRQQQDIIESYEPFLIPRQNLIALPVTTLQFPLYHPQFNETFLYSSLGFLLARELSNAFVDQNWSIDAEGNINGDLMEYFNVTFLQMHENYIDAKVREQRVSGFAFELALEAFSVQHPLGLNEAKLFLLNFAHNRCSNYIKFGDYMQIVNSAAERVISIVTIVGVIPIKICTCFT